ncbi:MAG: hypothetical protein WC836_16725 [Desulfobacula sp.]|jgi:hypothetical protein
MNIRKFKEADFQAILDVYAASKLDELCNEKTDYNGIPVLANKMAQKYAKIF